MHLIIGGAYQGKLTLAVQKYGFDQSELYDLALGLPDKPFSCFYHLEELTRRAFAQGLTPLQTAELLLPYACDSVVISREVGSGIVPMTHEDRAWRELHGAVLRLLADKAQSVSRVFCGIEEVLK